MDVPIYPITALTDDQIFQLVLAPSVFNYMKTSWPVHAQKWIQTNADGGRYLGIEGQESISAINDYEPSIHAVITAGRLFYLLYDCKIEDPVSVISVAEGGIMISWMNWQYDSAAADLDITARFSAQGLMIKINRRGEAEYAYWQEKELTTFRKLALSPAKIMNLVYSVRPRILTT